MPRSLPSTEHRGQLYLDLGIVCDYQEDRHAAMEAYEAASRVGGSEPVVQSQAPYLYGRAAKSKAYWRGWDAYNSHVSAVLRSEGGAARMHGDPVAALSSPLSPAEMLQLVRAAVDSKLEEAASIAPIEAGARLSLGTPPTVAPGRAGLRRGGERLRIGLVSSYFRDHNLLRLTRGLFLNHTRDEIALYLIAESDDDGTPILRSVQRAAASFTRIRGRTTADARASIMRQRPHLVINLNGHHWNAASETVRFALFSPARVLPSPGQTSAEAGSTSTSQPAVPIAPVTAAYMGYPGPTGAASLSYTYVDTAAVPPAHARFFTERLVLMPTTCPPPPSSSPLPPASQRHPWPGQRLRP